MPTAKLPLDDKPKLFFSTNDSDKEWRYKEKIVAIIESFLDDDEPIATFSSTKVIDVIGEKEQVDVASVKIDDPSKLFSFIEVRDRKDKVGRNYIQEIVGKRKSLRTESCKIVSTRAFTPNAVKLALHEGISLRCLLQVPEKGHWYSGNFMKTNFPIIDVTRCLLRVKVDEKYQEFEAAGNEIQKKVFLVFKDGVFCRNIPLLEVFRREVMNRQGANINLFKNCKDDGQMVEQEPETILFRHPQLFIYINSSEKPNTEKLACPVEGIHFIFKSGLQSLKGSIKYRYTYYDVTKKRELGGAVIGVFASNNINSHLCLVKWIIDEEKAKLGGVLFLHDQRE